MAKISTELIPVFTSRVHRYFGKCSFLCVGLAHDVSVMFTYCLFSALAEVALRTVDF